MERAAVCTKIGNGRVSAVGRMRGEMLLVASGQGRIWIVSTSRKPVALHGEGIKIDDRLRTTAKHITPRATSLALPILSFCWMASVSSCPQRPFCQKQFWTYTHRSSIPLPIRGCPRRPTEEQPLPIWSDITSANGIEPVDRAVVKTIGMVHQVNREDNGTILASTIVAERAGEHQRGCGHQTQVEDNDIVARFMLIQHIRRVFNYCYGMTVEKLLSGTSEESFEQSPHSLARAAKRGNQ